MYPLPSRGYAHRSSSRKTPSSSVGGRTVSNSTLIDTSPPSTTGDQKGSHDLVAVDATTTRRVQANQDSFACELARVLAHGVDFAVADRLIRAPSNIPEVKDLQKRLDDEYLAMHDSTIQHTFYSEEVEACQQRVEIAEDRLKKKQKDLHLPACALSKAMRAFILTYDVYRPIRDELKRMRDTPHRNSRVQRAQARFEYWTSRVEAANADYEVKKAEVEEIEAAIELLEDELQLERDILRSTKEMLKHAEQGLCVRNRLFRPIFEELLDHGL